MKYIICILILAICGQLSGQVIAAERISYPVWKSGIYSGTDALGNVYAADRNTFAKFTAAGTLTFQDLSLGRISRADLQNPLSVLLFYEDFNTAVLVDNQLNEIRRISFSELREPVVATAVGTAAMNRLWVFDSLTQRLGFYDYSSNRFVPLTQALAEGVGAYMSDFNYFHWTGSDGKWYACDQFGKITLQGILPEHDSVVLAGADLYVYAANGQIFVNDLKKGQLYSVENVEKSFTGFTYKDQILSIFTDGSITNYKITIP